ALAAPESARRGEKLTVRVQVANNGAAALPRVLLTALLPGGLRHAEGGRLQLEIGPLPPGAVKNVPLEVQAIESGRQVCAVEAVADGVPPARSRAAVRVADAGLEL